MTRPQNEWGGGEVPSARAAGGTALSRGWHSTVGGLSPGEPLAGTGSHVAHRRTLVYPPSHSSPCTSPAGPGCRRTPRSVGPSCLTGAGVTPCQATSLLVKWNNLSLCPVLNPSEQLFKLTNTVCQQCTSTEQLWFTGGQAQPLPPPR